MKPLLTALLAFALLGLDCDNRAPSDPCLDVALVGTADLGFPVILPIGEEPLVGGGAFPTEVTMGPFVGTLASVVIEQEVDESGVARFSLAHNFESGEHAFWTDDRGVCTPVADNPAACDVVTEMTVVGGRGAFAGASGEMRNEGRITFTDPTFESSPYGSLEFDITGRVCAAGL